MEKTIENGYSEELAEYVTSAMEKKGLTRKTLAKKLGVVYEHARRLSHGFVQSGPMMRAIVPVLGLDLETLEDIVKRASIRRKFGDDALVMQGIDPELEPVERNWKKLTDEQKEDVITLVKTMAKRNKGGKP